ncbi:MAG: hypothetical protein NTV79_10090, partial [Candidatus Aureabacteria bacterium]|nr:hypothetical protein [Candidatus Auribacterota bacterium]
MRKMLIAVAVVPALCLCLAGIAPAETQTDAVSAQFVDPVPDYWNGGGTAALAVFRAPDGLWAIKDLSRFYLGSMGDLA